MSPSPRIRCGALTRRWFGRSQAVFGAAAPTLVGDLYVRTRPLAWSTQPATHVKCGLSLLLRSLFDEDGRINEPPVPLRNII